MPQCSWLLEASALVLLWAALRRELRAARRWALLCAALVAAGLLEALGVLPSSHWLAGAGTASWALIVACAAGAAAGLSARRRPTGLGALAFLAPFCALALSAARGCLARENTDSLRYIVLGQAIEARGLPAFLRAWLGRPMAPPLQMFGLPAAWAALHHLAVALGAADPWASVAADRLLGAAGWLAACAGASGAAGRLFGKPSGRWAALVMAFAMPVFGFYSCFLLADGPMAGLAALCAWAWLAALDGDSPALAAASGALWTAAASFKLIAFAELPLLAALALTRVRKRPLAAACGFLLGAAAVPSVLGLSCSFGWRQALELARRAREALGVLGLYRRDAFPSFALFDPEGATRWFYLRHAAALFGALPVLLAVHSLSARPSRGGESRETWVLSGWLLAFVLFLSAFRTRDERFLALAYPFAAALAGGWLAGLEAEAGAGRAAALVAAAAVLWAGQLWSDLRSPWLESDFVSVASPRGRQALAQAASRQPAGNSVVSRPAPGSP